MPSLSFRMRKLNTLLDVRLGPGAAVLQGNISRIHLSFAAKIDDGHRGPRKFWRLYLPRLKYHNPAIPMTVERNDNQKGPASLTVFFSSSSSSSSSSSPSSPVSDTSRPTIEQSESESSKVIDMKHKDEAQILDEFLKLVEGAPVLATPADEQKLRELEDSRIKAQVDRARTKKVYDEQKRQRALLAQAKASASVEAV